MGIVQVTYIFEYRSPLNSAIRDLPPRGSCSTLPFREKFFKIGPTVLGCIPNDSLILLLFNPFEFNITIRSFQSVDSSLFLRHCLHLVSAPDIVGVWEQEFLK